VKNKAIVLFVLGLMTVFRGYSSDNCLSLFGHGPIEKESIAVAMRSFYTDNSLSNSVSVLMHNGLAQASFSDSSEQLSAFWLRMDYGSFVSPQQISCEDVFYWHLIGQPDQWSGGPMLRSEYPSPFRFGPLDSRTLGVFVGKRF
jgi:hypothetical protein